MYLSQLGLQFPLVEDVIITGLALQPVQPRLVLVSRPHPFVFRSQFGLLLEEFSHFTL